MGFLDKLRTGGTPSTIRMPVKFKTKVTRRTAGEDLVFDADVKGYFIGKGGKPDFVVEEVKVTGIPNMNMNSFLPKEVIEIREQALREEYPRLLGIKKPG